MPDPSTATSLTPSELDAKSFQNKLGINATATCTGTPLETPNDVTRAVRGPTLGRVPKTIVSDVVEADEILATVAPLLRVTTLSAAVAAKFEPEITSVVEALDKLVELVETDGGTKTVATTTKAPLERPKDDTEAESGPRLGRVPKTIVSDVVEADEILATVAPLLRVTTLSAAVEAKFEPEITSVVEALDRLVELVDTEGGTRTVATRTSAPLERPKDDTEAESGPGLGSVPKTIVSDVVEAAQIEPTVPLLSVTTLPPADG